jgi:hypothetical protein
LAKHPVTEDNASLERTADVGDLHANVYSRTVVSFDARIERGVGQFATFGGDLQ